MDLIDKKLSDHHCGAEHFLTIFKARAELLEADPKVAIDLRKEMSRFLSADLVTQTVNQPAFWAFLVGHIRDLYALTEQTLRGNSANPVFKM
ncbi:hypothetical protein [Pseudomonas sp. R5(2019)]|uniref:hypothetical protein n=1 Tax=Pseudomonas sp. R5(2019) TaxID=2697566 RepID=UPI00141200B9|nr:hypothetical protein [Pseudomonas sp. R5(2019)]NBA97154.1 hypothetical protein [Pseudomonas sp. R5(2019)]